MMIKTIIFAFFLFLPVPAFAQLDPAIEGKKAENFIKELGSDAIEALENTTDDETARRKALEQILTRNFDTDTIARFSMGRYWAAATDAERSEYKKLFKKMIVDVYTERFSEYTNQKFIVTGNQPIGKDFIVKSTIDMGSGQPINLDWRVRRGKVIDVIVEGISMSVTQRSEFASIIQRNGGQVSALIDHLKS